MPSCWTLTTTSWPSLKVARWTWAICRKVMLKVIRITSKSHVMNIGKLKANVRTTIVSYSSHQLPLLYTTSMGTSNITERNKYRYYCEGRKSVAKLLLNCLVGNPCFYSAPSFLVQTLTEAVARGTLSKFKNRSSMVFPNSFSMVWHTWGKTIHLISNIYLMSV